MYRGRFIAALRCGNRKCKDLTTIAGDVILDDNYDFEQQVIWHEEQLLPRFISPGPSLINLPADVPEDVAANVRVACQIVWAEPAAAGNRIRTAVERLLDDRGMRRKRRTTKGKYEQLSLHKRIEEYRLKDPGLGESLLAAKWLGNAGSHATLTRNDVFDALDMVEYVLDEVYTQRAKAVAKLAKKINKARGPARPGRTRGRR